MTGALDGIRVLEMGTLISGPFAGRLLGDMGAEVIKIEPPGSPDPLRTWGQAEVDGHHFFWTVHARNKKAITLNLREPQGRAIFLDLAQRSDIIVENFRPGTLEKWDLGYDVLRQRNPGIILVRVSGYGQTGPDAGKAGYASVAEAVSGLRHMNGFPGGPPPRLALSLGDTLAGMFAAQGALAALYRRTVTGEGQVVDTALTEACLAVQESTIPDYDAGGVVRGPSGTRLEGIAPSNIYQSADGSWVVIAANQDTVFRRLCDAMGRPELADDDRFINHGARGRNQDELDAIIADWARQRAPEDIIDTLSAAGVIAGPINTVAEVVRDPQFLAGVVQSIKDRLNSLTEEQAAAQQVLVQWRERIAGMGSAEEFNGALSEVKLAPKAAQAMFAEAAKVNGLKFDAKAKQYTEAVTA